MLVRPMLLHRMALVSVRLFCKNLGNLQEFFGQMVYRPSWQKIARTPMPIYKQGIACTIYLIFLMKFVSLKYSKAMTQMKLPINDFKSRWRAFSP